MNLTDIIRTMGTLAFGVATLNFVWTALLALPFSWLWNWTLVPLLHAPAIGYFRSLGLLLLWFVLHQVSEGVKLSAKFRDKD